MGPEQESSFVCFVIGAAAQVENLALPYKARAEVAQKLKAERAAALAAERAEATSFLTTVQSEASKPDDCERQPAFLD